MATRAKKASKPKGPPRKLKRPPRRKKAEPKSKGLSPAALLEDVPKAALALAEAVASDGGIALASYRDPLGGHPVVFASLPIDRVEPTPYQRDLSEAHVKKLANAMERVDRFLDPIIAVRHDGRYWTPNGHHRLGASRLLGTQAVMALVVPEEEVAFQILALNTEKAHNLKERSLEVVRMYRGLVGARGGTEVELIDLLEEAAFVTLGICYEQRPRFSGGAYHPILKRVDAFLETPLEEALAVREARAKKLLTLDDHVSRAVEALKARGMVSPYLRNFVVARVNYLRFVKGEPPSFDEALDKMLGSAERFDAEKVKKEDLSKMGGAPAESED
jgi:ParB family chromosome partitioning protein